jgi:hypothetical protein
MLTSVGSSVKAARERAAHKAAKFGAKASKKAAKLGNKASKQVTDTATMNPMASQLKDAAELAAALAGVPLPEVIAVCSHCGFASPLRTCDSAGELLQNSVEGDRRKLLDSLPEDFPEDEPPTARLRLTHHSIHVQRLDTKKAKTDLYDRLESHSVVVQDPTGNKLSLVPVRSQDIDHLLSCLHKVTEQTERYATDAESPVANKEESPEDRDGSFVISVIDKELRSNGWNYVMQVSTTETVEIPTETYYVKATFRQMQNLKQSLDFRFPYIMSCVKPRFPDRQV